MWVVGSSRWSERFKDDRGPIQRRWPRRPRRRRVAAATRSLARSIERLIEWIVVRGSGLIGPPSLNKQNREREREKKNRTS